MRTYGDRCGVARALDLVGERWALLVVRELLLGPKRFSDLRAGLPHVSPDVLAQRLRELEQADVLRRAVLPPPAASRVYELTGRGHELQPVILALGRWGSQAPFPPDADVFSPDSVVIAMMSSFAPDHTLGLEASYELRIDDHVFRALISGGRFSVRRGRADRPDATVSSASRALSALLWHGRSLAAALRAGETRIEGDRRAVELLLRAFTL